MARPMPRLDPVTRATFPFRLMALASSKFFLLPSGQKPLARSLPAKLAGRLVSITQPTVKGAATRPQPVSVEPANLT